MHPDTPAQPGMPTDPEPIAQVNTGMRVVDATGADVGKVTAVKMADTGTADQLDLDQEVAQRLVSAGYVVVDGGVLSRDLYAEAGQIAVVDEGGDGMDGVVTLSVTADELTRAH